MKNDIIAALSLALEQYEKRVPLPGIQTSFFLKKSRIKNYNGLLSSIKECENDLEALNLLTDHLTQKSEKEALIFNQYLITALKHQSRSTTSMFKHIDWNCFTPYAVVTSTGLFFRGTKSIPEKVFKNGFSDHEPSKDQEDYLLPTNLSTGVSVSKSYDIAKSYAKSNSKNAKDNSRNFVYFVDYHGLEGYDIIDSAKARGTEFYKLKNSGHRVAISKHEVNIKGKVPAECIIGAVEFLANGETITHKNPNFKVNYIDYQTSEFNSDLPRDIISSLIRFTKAALRSVKLFFYEFIAKYIHSKKLFEEEISEIPLDLLYEMGEEQFDEILDSHALLRNKKMISNRLKFKLKKSAVRKGISTAIYGLITQGVSDHLPIQAQVKLPSEKISVFSWNILSDDHLFNNLLNVTGYDTLLSILKRDKPDCIYSEQHKLYHLFAELGQFLYQDDQSKVIQFNIEEFESFINKQPSRLARSRDPVKQEKLTTQLRASRYAILDLLKTDQAFCSQFIMALKHSLDIIHHIKNEQGALTWKNRIKMINEDINLRKMIKDTDILCFQECTNPDDLKSLISDQHALITHKLRNSHDHCVFAYNSDKYELVEVKKDAIHSKKPAIFALLRSKKTNKLFISGSVHLPGIAKNNPDCAEKLKENITFIEGNVSALEDKARALSENLSKVPFVIAGDVNNPGHVYHNNQLHYPKEGTMTGNDFGNYGKGIDAVYSNIDKTDITVSNVYPNMPVPNALRLSSSPSLNALLDENKKLLFAYPNLSTRVEVTPGDGTSLTTRKDSRPSLRKL